jgi:restriction system protein
MDIHFKYKYDDLFNPTLNALKNLGGSGSVSEIEEQVIAIKELNLGVSVEMVEEVKIKTDWFKNL